MLPGIKLFDLSGKIAVIADSASSNPILVSGKTMDVNMVLNQAVDTFTIGFNGQAAHVVTSDNVDHVVGAAARCHRDREHQLQFESPSQPRHGFGR